jgi:hypothetical protein
MPRDLTSLLWALLWPPLFGSVAWKLLLFNGPRVFSWESFWEGYFSGACASLITFSVDWAPVPFVISAGQLVLAVVMWWLSRRKRKRSAKLIGAKSRALLAAVVARMRGAAKPRPVLRPVPGGSGA